MHARGTFVYKYFAYSIHPSKEIFVPITKELMIGGEELARDKFNLKMQTFDRDLYVASTS